MRLCLGAPDKAKKPCPSKKVAREFSHTGKKRKKSR